MLEIPAGKIMIPFMLAAGAGAAQEINKTRMTEAVIIGLVVGAITFAGGKYVALPVIEERLDNFIKDGQETRRMLIEMRQEFRKDITEGRARRDSREAALEAKIVALQVEAARRR